MYGSPMIGATPHLERGVGGRDCTCCAPAPGKGRKTEKRMVKRRERNAMRCSVAKLIREA